MIVRLRLLSLALFGIGFCLGGAAAQANSKASETDKQSREEIDKLIGQLKSDNFNIREEATRQLMQRDEALPALQRAAKSDDAEVAERARIVIEAINKRLAKRAIQRAIARLKKGQTDQFVEGVMPWRKYMDEEGWKAALEHTHAIAVEAGKVGERKFGVPLADTSKLRFIHADHLKLPQYEWINRQCVIAESISLAEGMIRDSFLICDGSVKSKLILSGSVVFANGNLTLGDQDTVGGISRCIVVCDGNVAVTCAVDNCVILARGNVRVGASVNNSVIVGGGDVKLGLVFKDGRVNNSFIQEHQRDPLNAVHFFDPAQAGIEVKTSRNQVRVERVAEAKAFARAGVRQGDQIVTVDGGKVDSAETFRRLLRRRMHKLGFLILEVRREGKPLRLQVPIRNNMP